MALLYDQHYTRRKNMHPEKDRNQPYDPEGEPSSESYRGGGDVISKVGGDVIANESVPQSGLAEQERETKEGETVRTPLEPNRS